MNKLASSIVASIAMAAAADAAIIYDFNTTDQVFGVNPPEFSITAQAPGLRFTGTAAFQAGFLVSGVESLNTAAQNDVRLRVSPQSNNSSDFVIFQFIDAGFTPLATIRFDVPVSPNATPGYLLVTPSAFDVTGDLSTAFGFFLSGNGSGASNLNADLDYLEVVPEPSTYALFAAAGSLVGVILWRRRRS